MQEVNIIEKAKEMSRSFLEQDNSPKRSAEVSASIVSASESAEVVSSIAVTDNDIDEIEDEIDALITRKIGTSDGGPLLNGKHKQVVTAKNGKQYVYGVDRSDPSSVSRDPVDEAICRATMPTLAEPVTASETDSTLRQRVGWKPPAMFLQQEKYEHRIIAYLLAEGKSNVEIAEIVGKTPSTINYIAKQPWVEPLVLELIHQRGGDKVEIFIDELVMPALEVYKDVLTDPEKSTKDKLAAAQAVLDRRYGKPNQALTIKSDNRDPNQIPDAELADIAKRGSVAAAPTTTG